MLLAGPPFKTWTAPSNGGVLDARVPWAVPVPSPTPSSLWEEGNTLFPLSGIPEAQRSMKPQTGGLLSRIASDAQPPHFSSVQQPKRERNLDSKPQWLLKCRAWNPSQMTCVVSNGPRRNASQGRRWGWHPLLLVYGPHSATVRFSQQGRPTWMRTWFFPVLSESV